VIRRNITLATHADGRERWQGRPKKQALNDGLFYHVFMRSEVAPPAVYERAKPSSPITRNRNARLISPPSFSHDQASFGPVKNYVSNVCIASCVDANPFIRKAEPLTPITSRGANPELQMLVPLDKSAMAPVTFLDDTPYGPLNALVGLRIECVLE